MTEAAENDQWLTEARIGEHLPETLEYGINSFTFRAVRPMHPERLYEAFQQMQNCEGPFNRLLRGKGFVWLASCHDLQGIFAFAGQYATLLPGEPWWAMIDKNDWPENLAEAIAPLWHEPYGDRQQEIVMIGQNLDIEAVEKILQSCLLSDEEYNQGINTWKTFSDPFVTEFTEMEASN